MWMFPGPFRPFCSTLMSPALSQHVSRLDRTLQYVKYRYTVFVRSVFLNVDTCTAYCNSMHSTAFHRSRTEDYNLYRSRCGKTKSIEVHPFYVWQTSARWYPVSVQFNWGGSFAHSSIKTLLLMHSDFLSCLGLDTAASPVSPERCFCPFHRTNIWYLCRRVNKRSTEGWDVPVLQTRVWLNNWIKPKLG